MSRKRKVNDRNIFYRGRGERTRWKKKRRRRKEEVTTTTTTTTTEKRREKVMRWCWVEEVNKNERTGDPETVPADDAAAGWRGKKRVHIAAEAINRCSPSFLSHTHTHTVNGYTVCTSVYVLPYSASYLDTHTQTILAFAFHYRLGGEKIEEKGTCQNYLLFSLFLSRWHRFTSSHRVVTPAEMMTTNQPTNQTTKQPRKGGGEETKENRTMTPDWGNKFP